ncbi:LysR family transcriptional regulator [Thiotrichales bacterium 19X7-9]|nr:LysR family transcriptional regulator [Thiotrichales bacterium 19X7-9]
MHDNIQNINLNLLKTLVVLLEERHVSKAALRLNITQAAVSRSLKQLREIFNDELLVRTKNEMLLTEKALVLLPEANKIIISLDHFFTHKDHFDPFNTQANFTIGMGDYGQIILLPQLVNHLEQNAPNSTLNIFNRTVITNQTELESGIIDLMIGYFEPIPPNIMQKRLWTDRLVCLVGKENALANIELTIDNFADFQYAVIAYNDLYTGSNTINYLKKYPISVKPKLIVQTISAACLLLCQTNLILIATRQIANAITNLLPINVLNYPFDDEPRDVCMYWHKRFNQYKSHQWLRNQIIELSHHS